MRVFLPGFGVHCTNGSPTKPEEQTHIGVWLIILHSALAPQEPGQGSRHFWFMHAKLVGHSLLLMHSGLQYGGEPINSGKQLHEGEFSDIWHWALGPHGDGWQTFIGSGWIGAKNFIQILKMNLFMGAQIFVIFFRLGGTLVQMYFVLKR